jgi:hypothetical protein
VTNIKCVRKIIHTHSKFEEKICKTTLSSHSDFLFKREGKNKTQFLSGTFKWVYIHPIGAKVGFVRSAQRRPFKTKQKRKTVNSFSLRILQVQTIFKEVELS